MTKDLVPNDPEMTPNDLMTLDPSPTNDHVIRVGTGFHYFDIDIKVTSSIATA